MLPRVDGIDGAGAVGITVAGVRHLHVAALLRVKGMAVTGTRRRHRSGTAEIYAKRRSGALVGGKRAGIGAGDEGDRHQGHRPEAVKMTNH